jgi:hypothetical protein
LQYFYCQQQWVLHHLTVGNRRKRHRRQQRQSWESITVPTPNRRRAGIAARAKHQVSRIPLISAIRLPSYTAGSVLFVTCDDQSPQEGAVPLEQRIRTTKIWILDISHVAGKLYVPASHTGEISVVDKYGQHREPTLAMVLSGCQEDPIVWMTVLTTRARVTANDRSISVAPLSRALVQGQIVDDVLNPRQTFTMLCIDSAVDFRGIRQFRVDVETWKSHLLWQARLGAIAYDILLTPS